MSGQQMNCPTCGARNRPNAKFCVQCRASLAPVMTMKMCPQCGKQNRMRARFCAHCGHTFTTWTDIGIHRRITYAAVAVIVVFMLVISSTLLAGRRDREPTGNTMLVTTPTMRPPTSSLTPISAPSSTQRGSTAPTFSEALNRALLATVQLIVPVDGQSQASAGSGSILTEQGHILTSFHIVGDPDTGQLYNRQGLIHVAVNPPDLRGPPEIKYIAQLMQGDQDLDLALIKIIATQDGHPLQASPHLTTMPIGDSDTVAIGDELSIIGFPGLGGATVTFTKGTVSGFLTDEGWIKTDAEINLGNSGGAAINRKGQLVGIPSAAAAEMLRLPGKIGLVRPVNLARSLIDLALEDAR